VITINDACHYHRISEAEFFAWQRTFENYGIVGLRLPTSRFVNRPADAETPLSRPD